MFYTLVREKLCHVSHDVAVEEYNIKMKWFSIVTAIISVVFLATHPLDKIERKDFEEFGIVTLAVYIYMMLSHADVQTEK